jgi:hypothetical protein
MREEHLILCGNTLPKKPSRAKRHNLQLGKDKRKEQISLDSEALTEKMVQELPNILQDLLEVATFVYVGDQIVSRGGIKSFDYGLKWHRCLHFAIPVREYDTWSDPAIKELLEQCLSFSSGDTYTFEFFAQAEDRFPQFLNFKSRIQPQSDYDEVLLFSGGIDSFTGAVEEVVANQGRPVLVSHQSNNKLIGLQKALSEYIISLCKSGPKPLHIPIMINKKKELTRETSQRTRSFLYASLGTIVARIFGLSRVKFYENGVVSCNLPFDGQTLQARSTRSTHPRLLHLLSKFVSELTDSDFIFENPYFSKTKTEVCLRLKELHHEPFIEKTRSCAKSTYTKLHVHCGTCSQCIDRRFATLASECQKYDPEWKYALNIFKDELTNTQDRAMAAGFAGFSTQIDRMTIDDFVIKYSSEAHEIARYMPSVSREEAMRALFGLHRRHAQKVNGVLDAAIAENKSSIRKGTLPKTCLISMVGSGLHLNAGRIRGRSSESEKHAKGDLDSEVGRLLKLHPESTAPEIGDEIRNTTADAVRHTQAWKNRRGNP